MKLSIEITMYPLEDKYLPIIENFIEHLKNYKDINLEVFPTSTVIVGDFDTVIDILSSSIKWSVNNKDKAVFITKFLPNYQAL
ncbi:MAG: histidine kinase [Rhizobiales bacterium TMED168]|nr:MAG: histidine kinase [Rhizobiales bacterium TMED168]|tara:strand:- start:12996 stop:13244 length:249 start_codon:yes stop_codon:yes gene_type:complete